jgi:hypothetical protein
MKKAFKIEVKTTYRNGKIWNHWYRIYKRTCWVFWVAVGDGYSTAERAKEELKRLEDAANQEWKTEKCWLKE